MAQIQLYTAETAINGIAAALQAQGRIALRRKTPMHYKTMPWANGRGSTTELSVFPKETKVTDGSALWRVSMANVTEKGPFSLLPDYERIIAVAKGDGFRLTGDKETNVEVVPGVIHTFSGAEAINCELLGGPCLDLNIMYKRDKAKASLTLLGEAEPVHAVIAPQSGKETVILICLTGRAHVQAYRKPLYTLLSQDSVSFSSKDGKGSLVLKTQPHARVAVVTIETL